MNDISDEALHAEKEQAISIAQDLFYGEKTIDMIKSATTSYEIGRILHDARDRLL